MRVIKRDLSVDWTNNEIIKSRIRANVRLLLLQNQFLPEESENILDLVLSVSMVSEVTRSLEPALKSAGASPL